MLLLLLHCEEKPVRATASFAERDFSTVKSYRGRNALPFEILIVE